MSRWTHSICVPCWNKREPGREPIRLHVEFISWETCCFCGESHASGIHVREDPAKMLCQGSEGVHAPKSL